MSFRKCRVPARSGSRRRKGRRRSRVRVYGTQVRAHGCGESRVGTRRHTKPRSITRRCACRAAATSSSIRRSARILADLTIKIELARNAIWKAAWVLDHPEAISDRSVADLPWHTIARVYTAEAMHDVALGAAECFGAMGVMRDMPLQKYVHDAMVFLHAADHDSATKLEIAEAARRLRAAARRSLASRSNGFFFERRAAPLAAGGAQVRRRRAAPDVAQARPDRRRIRAVGLGHHREGLEARLPHARGAEGVGRSGRPIS